MVQHPRTRPGLFVRAESIGRCTQKPTLSVNISGTWDGSGEEGHHLPFNPEREPPMFSTSPPRDRDSAVSRWRISSLIILIMLLFEYCRHSGIATIQLSTR